jgi:acetyl-CoA acyltransferase 1
MSIKKMDSSKRLDVIRSHLTGSGEEVVICAAFRSPLTKAKRGGLKDTTIEEILAQLYTRVVETTKVDPSKIEEVVIGNVLKVGSNGMSLRLVQFMAGLPQSVACQSVNRMCASGLQAVSTVANQIRSGEISIGIAGGAESMSMFDMTTAVHPPLPERAFKIPDAANTVLPMGITSDNVVKQFGVTRAKMDQFAASSHAKAAAAQETGKFNEEIVPIKTTVKENGALKEVVITKDDGIRKETTAESLGKLRPAFNKNGGTTAGNSSQITDGAAVVLLASRKAAEANNLPILARWLGFAAVGVPPEVMGIGPAFAIPRALELAGITLNDVDVFEINEAFASQATYSVDKLGIDYNKVNPNGGAIALGHPLGCTGARQIATILPELRRRKGRYGVMSMCIGSGMGAAAVIENLVR